jgi:hypothetical protein
MAMTMTPKRTAASRRNEATPIVHALGGSVGSALALLLFYPLERARTEMQSKAASTSPASSSSEVTPTRLVNEAEIFPMQCACWVLPGLDNVFRLNSPVRPLRLVVCVISSLPSVRLSPEGSRLLSYLCICIACYRACMHSR